MFCVLIKDDGKKSGFGRLKKVSVQHVNYGKSRYDIVAVKSKKGCIPKKAVEKAVGGRPVIKQVDIIIKENFALSPFDSGMFKRHTEINTFFKVLSIASRFKRSVSVAFIDLDCRYCGCLRRIMELSNEVYIITNKIEEYTRYANQCFSEYGAAPIVTDGKEIADKCHVVFSPDGERVSEKNKCVFAPKKDAFHIETGCISTLYGCPKGVSEIDFAGALFELCGIERMGNLAADFMVKSGVKYGIKEIAERICLDIR